MKNAEKMNQIKKGILDAITKMKKSFESIDTTLSCLSCLEYLQDPLTLVCGHSICVKVMINSNSISVSKRTVTQKARTHWSFVRSAKWKLRTKT